MENYNLGEQLRQCAIITSPGWLQKKIDFSSELPDLAFRCNRELLQHLWLNLIGNAVKYTPENGTITLSLTSKDNLAIVEISDSGVGISEETQKHMFDPYFQGDTSRSVQGLGLGLSIAKRIVELCEGEISVSSVLGKGSTFTVKLPIK